MSMLGLSGLGRRPFASSAAAVLRRAASPTPPVLGQPHPSTHPHLFEHPADDGEVNRLITRDEFRRRRGGLAALVRRDESAHARPDDVNTSYCSKRLLDGRRTLHRHLVVVPSAQRAFMYDSIPYPFRQNSDFRYLTGGLEPDCLLVMEIDSRGEKSHLFVRNPHKRNELWEGVRTKASADTASYFGVDECHSMAELANFLSSYKNDGQQFCLWYEYLEPKCQTIHKTIMDFVHNLSSNQGIAAPRKIIHKLRAVKSAKEIELMRRSCKIAATSIRDTIKTSSSMSTEHELHASVDHKCRMAGAQFLAYPPVVAHGANAATIHYGQSNALFRGAASLVLMDAGCEYHGYTSDVTRTWPVDTGVYSPEQRIIYDIVYETHGKILDLLRTSSAVSIDDCYYKMQDSLLYLLTSAGVIEPSLSEEQKRASVSHFCPHHVSHHLGMDVHDCALVSKRDPLVGGNVITVEPGVYIPPNGELARKEFRGIGVRIEDDVWIKGDGEIEVLTQDCPIEPKEIEKLMK